MTQPLWVLTGATASGKSKLAMRLAAVSDVEILSMDSMAVYRRMDIGTAKPGPEERARVRHHLIDLVEPNESFDTNRYCAAAEAALQAVRNRNRQPLFVGGTPLYLVAFLKGMLDGPAAVPEIRTRLRAQEAQEPGSLHRLLQEHDPAAAERIHKNDVKRLTRALEVLEVTGRPISEQQDHFERPGFRIPCRILAVKRSRDDLHERVRHRTAAMLEQGLIDEVRRIRDDCGFSDQAATAIGYGECLQWLDGGYKDMVELRNMIRRATHRLIRRQTTWLRRIAEITWVEADVPAEKLLCTLQG
ncbi:MAG: tRNA (adenosine(37)-N6)-dimethylallyltransferase MiaA [Planctomycetota bacterium]|jgi:tRNA dimethylallyltransferase